MENTQTKPAQEDAPSLEGITTTNASVITTPQVEQNYKIAPLERKATLLGELAKLYEDKLQKAEALKLLGDVRYQQSRENNGNTRLRQLAKNCYMAARNLELSYRAA